MHLLYVPMTRKEQNMGLGLLAVMLACLAVFPHRSTALGAFLFRGVFFAAGLFLFRKFIRSSLEVPLTPFPRIMKFALLGYVLAFLANLLTNDLIFYFLPKYFYYVETGPHFLNLCKTALEPLAAESYPLTAVAAVLFVPVTEELMYRGLVFGNLARKSIPLACVVSTVLYCLVMILPVLGIASTDYVLLSFIQYIPVNLMFCWIYTRTETILTPILAHMVMNGISILALR